MRSKTPEAGARAVVYGRFSSDMQNPKSAEDQIAEGEKIEDVLFQMPITGHYRYFPGRGGAQYAAAQ